MSIEANLKDKRVTVIGGSGFVGRYIVRRLAKAGAVIRVAVRDVERAGFLRMSGEVGQVVPVVADVTRPASLSAATEGADVVINLVGILYPSGNNSFRSAQALGAAAAAKAAKEAGATQFIQVSAIGANAKSKAKYAKTKAEGEAGVLEAFPEATILRPSIVFGAEDGFFNMFAKLAKLTPILPLIGGGQTKFQPVSVHDVAEAVFQSVVREDVQGKTFELGGPNVYTFKELIEFTLKTTGRSRLLVPIPWVAAKIKAAFLQILPKPPLTVDQVELLKTDNVVADGALTLADLDINDPEIIEIEVPKYIMRYARRGVSKQ